MLLTLLREILQYFPRSESVMGWIVEGSFGVKYIILTTFRFSSVVANSIVPYMSFPFLTVSFLKYLHQAGLSCPLVIALIASCMHCVPGFINRTCLCSLDRGGSGTAIFFLGAFASEIFSTRVSASSSAVDQRGVSLFSQTALV